MPGYAAMSRLGGTRPELELRLRLLVEQLAAELSGCPWCIGQAHHHWLKSGVPLELRGALRKPTGSMFSTREQVALVFTDALCRYSDQDGGIPVAVLESLRQHFAEEEIVELTVLATTEHFFDPVTGRLGSDFHSGTSS
ncbi:MAG: carboxymuconolactone decarboxylase family protein [Gemmatimonadales bacterium]